MEIEQKFIISNNQGQADTCTPKYIVIHDTGNTNVTANAINHYKWINNNNDLGRSAHIFVDDERAIQIIPFNHMSYHTGALYKDKVDVPDCRNHNSIGIEFCVNQDGDLNKTLNHLADVVYQVQREFNIPMENIITHYMSSGKQCPSTFMKNPVLWNNLKSKIACMNLQNNTFHQAIQVLEEKGIINTPEYWQKQSNSNIQALIINMSNHLKKEK